TASTFVFQETYGLSAQQYGLLFGGSALLVTTGTQVAGFLMGRNIRPLRIAAGALVVAMTGSLCIVAVGLIVGTGPDRLWPLLLALAPTGGAAGVMTPTVPSLALAGRTRDAGSAAALIGSAQFALGAAGAPLSGLLGGSVVAMAAIMAACYA